jgi:Na+-driven multidrug efflux pump
MNPLLRALGASDNTMRYARQYLLFTVVLGGVPTVLSLCMPMLLRNAGYAREAGFGVGLGGVLNIALDPLFMFVLLPDGYQVLGAALATMLSNVVSLVYFILVYRRLRGQTVLELPRRIEKLTKESKKSFYSVGIPAAVILLLYDAVNIVLNRLAVGHGDLALAAVGIVLKVERLPVNIGLGVCLGMVPLVGYNYARRDFQRMDRFFSAARLVILAVALLSAAGFWLFAEPIVGAFIDDAETVRLGTAFLKGRCVAVPFMLLGFHIVNFMQAIDKGKVSFLLSVIRHLVLNIPAMIVGSALFGLPGLIWSQAVSDGVNIIITYLIYFRVRRKIG